MIVVARIHTDFPTKFGIPRQSGLAETDGRIVFEPEFRNPDCIRGIEGYSHLWLLWQFEDTGDENSWTPMVRPPRLGGNTKVGVFASRSPFRPNHIGLSSVVLKSVEMTNEGPVLHVSGADLRDNTPIYDIKPYLPFTDSHPDARGGFASEKEKERLDVDFPDSLLSLIPYEKRETATKILAQDPRPHYQTDSERIYGVPFSGKDIRFKVNGKVLTVIEVDDYAG